MADYQRKHVGARSEMIAAAWLLTNGYEVYRNVSAHGAVDIIATKDNDIHFFDVKPLQAGVRAPLETLETTSKRIRFLVVTPEGKCSIEIPRKRVETKCEICLTPFYPNKGMGKFCSKKCRAEWYRRKHRTNPIVVKLVPAVPRNEDELRAALKASCALEDKP